MSGGVKRSQPVADGGRPLFESGGDQDARLGIALSELAAERPEGTAAAAVGVLCRALADAGAEIAVGDLAVPASIDEAMAGVTSVVLVSPAVPAQELNVVASAARAGVGHVVKATSKASADSPIARRRWQTKIETGLAASGVPHTLLRSNAYMHNVLALAPAIAKTSSFGSSAGKGRIGMIDARACRELTFDQDKDAMIRAGVPEQIAEMNAQAANLTADGDAAWVTDDVPSLLGRPARSFEEFATDYANAFS